MTLSDKMAYKQVIGCLMLDPSLLLEYTDIDPMDFDLKVARICFIIIKRLFGEGAEKLTPIEIDQEVEKYEASFVIYKQEGGLDFLKVCYEFAEPSNFDLYYTRLKKYSLLRRLKKEKYDISDFYIEDKEIDDPLVAVKIQERFDEASLEDIMNNVEGKFNQIKAEFTKGIRDSGSPAENLDTLMEELQTSPNIGPELEGKIFSSACRGAREGCFYLKSAGSGAGKALPNSTVIPTPAGKRQVKDIKVGDYLFDAFGRPTKVLGVYPQGEKEVWEIEFKDGRKAHCCKDHLWSYCTGDQSIKSRKERKFSTSTLEQLANLLDSHHEKSYKVMVPMQYAVEYPEKEFYSSPYSMGVFLADKSLRYQLYHERLAILHNYPELRQAKDKFIPEDYLFGSVEQRFELLNGLLDISGNVRKKGQISVCIIGEKLKDNVIDLCQSLGLKVHVLDSHYKDANVCYNLGITGRPEDKIKLFKLKKKKDIILQWYNNNKQKESNNYLSVINIKPCDYKEEMTCFYVDNDEHLFLTEEYIVTHNTRTFIYDACHLCYPIRWSHEKATFIKEIDENGKIRDARRILFIVTEMDREELQTIILSYLSGVNEEHILTNNYELGEKSRVNFAVEIVKHYSDFFSIETISDPNLMNIETTIKKYATINEIKYVFFDYIHTTPSLISQFSKSGLREDVVLMMMSNQLKQLAKDYKLFIFSGTQVNATAMGDGDGEFKNEMSIRGAKSTSDKADLGYVMTRVSEKTWNSLVLTLKSAVHQGFIDAKYVNDLSYKPTHVIDIYKMRRGRYKNVRIWINLDLGTGRRIDLFMTTADNQPIRSDFTIYITLKEEEITNWRENDNIFK